MKKTVQKNSQQIDAILKLAKAMGAHLNISHWAVSTRVSPKGDQIYRLLKGRDLNTRTAEALVQKFAEIWPEDLEWPAGIPRPASGDEVAA